MEVFLVNLGDKIRKQREEKNMSIEELSAETFLSIAILKDIEAGKFDRYEGDETYVKMYLKKICNALDMDVESITDEYISLTQEYKVSQLDEEENNEKDTKSKKPLDLNISKPQLTRNKTTVYTNKNHKNIIRIGIIFVLIALIIGVIWFGISSTKSSNEDTSFDTTEESISSDGDVTTEEEVEEEEESTEEEEEPVTSDITITKVDDYQFEFTLPEDTETFTFKAVFGNDSWATMEVNGSDYSDFTTQVYSADDEVELEFTVSDFEYLDLKNGYSVGHKYYINDVEVPLTEDDDSEGITHLILTLVETETEE